jgi:hypothetical protein
MAERVQATTNLTIDAEALKRDSRPDHLGLQHASSTGWLYSFSRASPYVRLIQQSLDTATPSRRWRASKLRKGLVSLNEKIHDSALARLGQTVKEARNGRVREIVYQPSSLLDSARASAAMEPDSTVTPGSGEAA